MVKRKEESTWQKVKDKILWPMATGAAGVGGTYAAKKLLSDENALGRAAGEGLNKAGDGIWKIGKALVNLASRKT
jgi:hypothetical protein